MTVNEVAHEIEQLIWELVAVSLCDAQKSPARKTAPGGREAITIPGDVELSEGMGVDEPYDVVWKRMSDGGIYHLRMVDGALVQMLYSFVNGALVRHRLAYFPPPHLLSFDGDWQIYEDDELYGDIVGEGLVHVPLRFDFNLNDDANAAVGHPVSHLSLGQYPNCRIPVSAPLSPRTFMGFILRNFYHRAYTVHHAGIHLATHTLPKTLAEAEDGLLHIAVPSHVG